MSRQNHQSVAAELRKAGASSAEIAQLLPVAGALRQLHSHPVKAQPHGRQTLFGLLTIGTVAITVLLLLARIPILSPSSPLYGAQKTANTVAIAIDPSYRDTVMMKQAQAIQRLVATRTQPAMVLRAVADYRTVAQVYRSGSAHYSALLYCKHMLHQVAEQAPTAERQAILESLQAEPVT